MIVCEVFVMFVVYSVIGWIWESTYCSIKDGEWENRGFLYGPVVPIYGFGASATDLLFRLIPQTGALSLSTGTPVGQVFLICFFGSIILEYSTSWILEKLFHAVWWDYSNVPFNINGRVCLPASTGFGIAGVIIVTKVLPYVDSVQSQNTHPLLTEFLALLMMFVITVDFTLTVAALTNFARRVATMETELNDRIEASYATVQGEARAIGAKIGEKRDELAETRIAMLVKNSSVLQKNAVRFIKESRHKGERKTLRDRIYREIRKDHS